MFKCVKNIKEVPSTAPMIAAFLEKVSVEYHKDNDVKDLISELSLIIEKMKIQPLPAVRLEFEDRARLFILLTRMQEFLEIKQKFMMGEGEENE